MHVVNIGSALYSHFMALILFNVSIHIFSYFASDWSSSQMNCPEPESKLELANICSSGVHGVPLLHGLCTHYFILDTYENLNERILSNLMQEGRTYKVS